MKNIPSKYLHVHKAVKLQGLNETESISKVDSDYQVLVAIFFFKTTCSLVMYAVFLEECFELYGLLLREQED